MFLNAVKFAEPNNPQVVCRRGGRTQGVQFCSRVGFIDRRALEGVKKLNETAFWLSSNLVSLAQDSELQNLQAVSASSSTSPRERLDIASPIALTSNFCCSLGRVATRMY